MIELDIIMALISRMIIIYIPVPQISNDFPAVIRRKCIHLSDMNSVQVGK